MWYAPSVIKSGIEAVFRKLFKPDDLPQKIGKNYMLKVATWAPCTWQQNLGLEQTCKPAMDG